MESMNNYLCELFYNVMDKNLAGFLNIQKVRHVNQKLPKNRKKCKGKKAKENFVHKKAPQNHVPEGKEIASFYECRACLASSTAKTFQELTVSNDKTITKMAQRKTINICCIAGGIVSELVAVIKILSNESKNFIHFSLKFLNQNNTWDGFTSAVLTELQSYANEEIRMKVSWDFQLVPDKKEHPNQEVLESFQSADILLVTKFSQDLCDMKDKQLQQLLQVAFLQMKLNSLFIFIDNATADFIKYLEKELPDLQLFRNIYKKVNDYHTLTINSIEDHRQRYPDHFGVELNSSYCHLSVSAWLKTSRSRNFQTGRLSENKKCTFFEHQAVPRMEKQEVLSTKKQEVLSTKKQEVLSTKKQDVPRTEKQEAPRTEKQEASRTGKQEVPRMKRQERKDENYQQQKDKKKAKKRF